MHLLSEGIMKTVLIAYIIIINLIGFFIMGIDKRKAIKNKWRVPERTLFLIAFLFGSVGILIGMYLFHHKTRHLKFALGIPVILVIQLLSISFLFSWNARRMDSPAQAVQHELDLIRELDENTIRSYVAYEHLTNSHTTSDSIGEETAEAVKLFFKNFKYDIKSETIDGSQAQVQVSITNLDMRALASDLCKKIMKQSAALFPQNETSATSDYYRLLRDTLLSGDYETMETTALFSLKKDSSGWIIQIDSVLEDQLVSGFISYMNDPYILSAAEVLTIQLDAMKELDEQQWKEYLELEDIFATYNAQYYPLIDAEYTRQLAEYFDYEILRCTESGDTASAAIRIHSIDMEHVLEVYKEYLLTYAATSKSIRDDSVTFSNETARLLLQALQENVQSSAADINLTFQNNGSTWQLYFDETFTDALMGGMEHALNTFIEATATTNSRIISPARNAD